jgi:hypothetical protein
MEGQTKVVTIAISLSADRLADGVNELASWDAEREPALAAVLRIIAAVLGPIASGEPKSL